MVCKMVSTYNASGVLSTRINSMKSLVISFLPMPSRTRITPILLSNTFLWNTDNHLLSRRRHSLLKNEHFDKMTTIHNASLSASSKSVNMSWSKINRTGGMIRFFASFGSISLAIPKSEGHTKMWHVGTAVNTPESYVGVGIAGRSIISVQ